MTSYIAHEPVAVSEFVDHPPGGGGGGIPYSGLYREALPERGAFFKARSILKGRENCHFSTL